jgi:hypothetical protein
MQRIQQHDFKSMIEREHVLALPLGGLGIYLGACLGKMRSRR